MTIFYEIDKAACDLVARGVEPKAVILSIEQMYEARDEPGAASRFSFANGQEHILNLPATVIRNWTGPLVVGVPYALPAFPKGFKLDAPMPKKTSLLAQRITRLADHVEEWPHNKNPVMKALVKRLREFALDAAA